MCDRNWIAIQINILRLSSGMFKKILFGIPLIVLVPAQWSKCLQNTEHSRKHFSGKSIDKSCLTSTIVSMTFPSRFLKDITILMRTSCIY